MNEGAQFHRVFPLTGADCDVWVDGRRLKARRGQSLLSLLLEHGGRVRTHERTGEPRAGFCLMGACQDCWVWLSPTQRGRACTTPVEPGMRCFTRSPEAEVLP
ncbi:(2Fe-2S)-binding protein [Ancylobacter mangrovi]|uniref:(2Fe-2S)-binding protein n=1 Tax=Ancylobacter mangrovi TaxID=2972472 RepID=UPI0021623CFC|nr:(2Fe-2S)-binding protein [Ancylobacter mangrovi]MCS0505160.1 (2Fe-2S)-binding protein [Ancylobacter mangrovi]